MYWYYSGYSFICNLVSFNSKIKGIEDSDMQKYYKIVSKFMLGNGLSGKQIDAIINAINKNTCVELDELKKSQN